MKLDDLKNLDELVSAIGERNMTPGWIRREKPILYPEMRSEFVPMLWRYEEAKAGMKSAGRLIGTDLAERRNFVMRNPIAGNNYSTAAHARVRLPVDPARARRRAATGMRRMRCA